MGVGRIYQQTFIDTYTKVAFVKLYDRKNALVAADMLNDQLLPFFEEEDIRLLRVLTDRGTEYCGALEYYRLDSRSPLRSHYPASAMYNSRLEEDFAAEFEAKFSGT